MSPDIVNMVCSVLEDKLVNLKFIQTNRKGDKICLKDNRDESRFVEIDVNKYVRETVGSCPEDIADGILTDMLTGSPRTDVASFSFRSVRDSIRFALMRGGDKLTELVPNVKFLDLAVYFYIGADLSVGNIACITITDDILKSWGVTQTELLKVAIENTVEKHPFIVKPFVGMFTYEDLGAERADRSDMYLLTNREQYLGAGVILYPDVLAGIAEEFGDDLIIMLSSIHECVVMEMGQTDKGFVEYLKRTVCEVNETLDPQEVLSYSVYMYSRESKRIECLA